MASKLWNLVTESSNYLPFSVLVLSLETFGYAFVKCSRIITHPVLWRHASVIMKLFLKHLLQHITPKNITYPLQAHNQTKSWLVKTILTTEVKLFFNFSTIPFSQVLWNWMFPKPEIDNTQRAAQFKNKNKHTHIILKMVLNLANCLICCRVSSVTKNLSLLISCNSKKIYKTRLTLKNSIIQISLNSQHAQSNIKSSKSCNNWETIFTNISTNCMGFFTSTFCNNV